MVELELELSLFEQHLPLPSSNIYPKQILGSFFFIFLKLTANNGVSLVHTFTSLCWSNHFKGSIEMMWLLKPFCLLAVNQEAEYISVEWLRIPD